MHIPANDRRWYIKMVNELYTSMTQRCQCFLDIISTCVCIIDWCVLFRFWCPFMVMVIQLLLGDCTCSCRGRLLIGIYWGIIVLFSVLSPFYLIWILVICSRVVTLVRDIRRQWTRSSCALVSHWRSQDTWKKGQSQRSSGRLSCGICSVFNYPPVFRLPCECSVWNCCCGTRVSAMRRTCLDGENSSIVD